MGKPDETSDYFHPITGEMFFEGKNTWWKFHKYGWFLVQEFAGSKASMQLLQYMMENMNYENWLNKKQSQIAEDLDLSRGHVSRILSRFEELDICINGRGTRMINPEVVFYEKNPGGERKRKLVHTYYKNKRKKNYE